MLRSERFAAIASTAMWPAPNVQVSSPIIIQTASPFSAARRIERIAPSVEVGDHVHGFPVRPAKSAPWPPDRDGGHESDFVRNAKELLDLSLGEGDDQSSERRAQTDGTCRDQEVLNRRIESCVEVQVRAGLVPTFRGINSPDEDKRWCISKGGAEVGNRSED